MTKFASKLGAIAIAAAVIVGATGTAGAQTTADLQAQIAALLAQITALQAQAGTSTTTTTSYTFTRDLTVGSTGSDVMELQKFLNANGYTVAVSGAGSAGNESSYFGSLTQSALSKFQAAKGIYPTAGYFGPKTRAYIATMTTTTSTTTTTTTTTTTSAPLSVSLATDNPGSANVQKGSANNQVLKFTLTGGATATTVTGLTLKSYGTTEATGTTDIPAVKLYDENNLQLGSNRTPTGNQVYFVIVPALTIPANGTRTITVTADVGASANTMAIVRYGIESATSITGGTTFTGSYPVIGNNFTIVPAGQLGTVSVSKFSTVPKTSVKTGEADVVLSRINVSAGSNEAAEITQVTFTNTGTISGTDISSLRLRKVGETAVLAESATLVNNKITFNLTTPVALVKGGSINLELIGNIAGDQNSNARTIIIGVVSGGVVARGTTSGTNITSSGATFAGDSIAIGLEQVVVSMSASHPQGADALLIKTTNKKDIAKFDVRANGGSIILNTINVDFSLNDNGGANNVYSTTSYLSSVGLYDGDALVSDLVTVDGDADGTDPDSVAFSLNLTIPANTMKTLTVKGITNTLAFTTSATLTTAWSGYNGYGLSSGATLSSNADTTTTNLTVYPSGTATFAADTTKTPYSQGVLSPANNVTVATLRVYAQREDQKLKTLTIGSFTDDNSDRLNSGGREIDAMANVSSLTLYADDGVTQLSNPVVPAVVTGGSTDAVATFSANDLLNDVVFTKGQYKTLLVKANITGADALKLTFDVGATAKDFTTTGMDSGTDFESGAAFTYLTFATPYDAAQYNIDSHIVEMKKAATSPSGTVARGTLATYAVWDVTNAASDQATLAISEIMFTSKTGLPTGLTDGTDANDALLFELYDGDGNKLGFGGDATDVVVLNKGNGTIKFTDATDGLLTIAAGEAKQLVLRITTTDTAKFPSNSQMQWSVEAVGHAIVESKAAAADAGNFDGDAGDDSDGFLGYGTAWTIPAVTNVVTMP